MRNIEDFKRYVYDKADDVRAKRKRQRRIWLNAAASLSVFAVCFGLFYYFNLSSSVYDANKAEGLPETAFKTAGGRYYAEENLQETSGAFSDAAAPENATVNLYTADDSLVSVEQEILDTAQFMTKASALLGATNYSHYSVAENDASYTGELSDIDFDTCVAVTIWSTFASEPTVQQLQTEYTDEVIYLTLVTDIESTPTGSYMMVYTALIDRDEYTGQPISIQIIQP